MEKNMKKILVIAALTMLAGCKSLYICDADESKISKEAAALRQESVVLESQDGMFALNSAKLSESSKAVLNDVAAKLKRNPTVKVEINGYTDNTGAESYNISLSKKRADSAAAYLESQGIAKSRISTFGYGPKNPVASNATAEGRALNRRVEILYR